MLTTEAGRRSAPASCRDKGRGWESCPGDKGRGGGLVLVLVWVDATWWTLAQDAITSWFDQDKHKAPTSSSPHPLSLQNVPTQVALSLPVWVVTFHYRPKGKNIISSPSLHKPMIEEQKGCLKWKTKAQAFPASRDRTSFAACSPSVKRSPSVLAAPSEAEFSCWSARRRDAQGRERSWLLCLPLASPY